MRRSETSEEIAATIRNWPGEKVDLLADSKHGIFAIQHVYAGCTTFPTITLDKAEFIALLRAGLECFKIDGDLIESVLPKLSKANIVK